MEFNAPNLVYLGWLDESFIQEVRQPGEYALGALEAADNANQSPKVIVIPISHANDLYLSMRDSIGPYDSRYLDPRYERKLSVHIRGSRRASNAPKRTQLLAVLGEGESRRFNDKALLKRYGEIVLTDVYDAGRLLRFRIDLVPAGKEVLRIQAHVDGSSDLTITKAGVYWSNGRFAKPGRCDGRNEPTYVNGMAWIPKWGEPEQDRGVDRSEAYPLELQSLDLDVELLAVANTRSDTHIDPRTPIGLTSTKEELILHIPDREPGSRWYSFVLREQPERCND